MSAADKESSEAMAEKSKPIEEDSATANPAEDAELDDLLADALNDFGKPPPEPKNAVEETKPVKEDVKPPKTSAGGDDMNSLLGGQFEKDFFSALTANFQEEIQEMLSQGLDPSSAEEFSANFHKVAEETAKAFSEQNLDSEFSATISQALKNLTEGAENLPNIFADDNVSRLLSNMTMEGADDIVPFIHQMMQTLLSKDILYPALKDLLGKYDGWLNENKSRLETSDYDRYRKQQSLIQEVCAILESEEELDAPEVKKQRFDSLIGLMHQVQDCGQPPKELMDSIKHFEDLPTQPDSSLCSVM